MKLVSGENYFPFAAAQIPQRGWSFAVINAVFADMNVDVSIEILPWTRGFQWTLDGHYIGTFPYVYSEERAKDFIYSDPINWVPVHLYVSAASDILSMDQLYGKTLCLPHGYVLDSWSKQFYQKFDFSISHAQNAIGCAGQVLKGWSDVSQINGYFTRKETLDRFGSLDGVRVLATEVASIPLHFIIAKGTPDADSIMQRFNTSLKAITASGKRAEIDQFYRLWLKQPTEQD